MLPYHCRCRRPITVFEREQVYSIAEAFLRMTLLFLFLTNFYQIFKESCHFENPVETRRKWKFVVGAD